MPKTFKCIVCGKTFKDRPSRNRQACSPKCSYKIKRKCPWKGKKLPTQWRKNLSIAHQGKTGNKASNWRGGVSKSTQGYVIIYQPNHPLANCRKYVKRCVLVMEKKIGRHLTPKEVVHHINEIKDDDRPENLRLFVNNSEHRKFHRPKGKKF